MATNVSQTTLPAAARTGTPKKAPAPFIQPDALGKNSVLAEAVFHAALTLERRRAERSRKPFVLMLLDAHRENGLAGHLLKQAHGAVAASTRETDLLGWYKKGSVLGVIFTELGPDASSTVADTLHAKVGAALEGSMGAEKAARIAITLHLFPENWDPEHAGWVADTKLYPDLKASGRQKKTLLGLKRAMDIAGSAALLLLLSPVLAVIAAIIKFTSKGPVLFEQERLGQFGARFKCLKFRSMYVDSASKIHQDYIQKFIAGGADEITEDSASPTVYKIMGDPRVTSIGRFLRKSSLDELPQFWNVLRGEMSLVGPRPPVPYEFEIYDVWHRRRVLEVKPGVTGLWQVSGRSRTRFDDMVRLDLRYCRSWSLWLDVKILAATPWAVFSGDGAY